MKADEDKLIMTSIPERKYNVYYSWFCTIMLVFVFNSSVWSRKILSPMYGFGIENL